MTRFVACMKRPDKKHFVPRLARTLIVRRARICAADKENAESMFCFAVAIVLAIHNARQGLEVFCEFARKRPEIALSTLFYKFKLKYIQILERVVNRK